MKFMLMIHFDDIGYDSVVDGDSGDNENDGEAFGSQCILTVS